MQMQTVHPIINEDIWVAGHQTLVAVFTKKDASEKFVERSTRFITSLNHSNTIKADIISVSDGVFYNGLIFVGKNYGQRSCEDIRKFAKQKGYAQVCILEPAQDE